ncbi:MAG: hypothetical protein U0271_16290 [Polyangiaceae bacterium]
MGPLTSRALSIGAMLLVACGASHENENADAPPAAASSTSLAASSVAASSVAESASPGAAPATPPATSHPEQLVQAIFRALQLADAAGYAALGLSTEADYAALGALSSSPPKRPSEAKLAEMRDKRMRTFQLITDKLVSMGITPRTMTLGDIDLSRVGERDGAGFAEDLTFIVQSGETKVRVTIDDCLLTRRGWIYIDGLKLRDQHP